MRQSRLFAAILAVLCAPAFAQTPVDNAEVRAAAQAFDDAQLHGDRVVLERMLAPDFLLVRGSGRIGDKADFIAGFADPKSHLEPFEISDRLFIRPTPDTAIVGGEARVRGTADGKPFAEHFRYSDTFARRNGQWIVIYAQVTPLPTP
jgi:ketosteroid isomerase-like protein